MGQNESNELPLVLLVEDEWLVRMTAANDLKDAGFQVLEAANADGALRMLEARSDEVVGLFTNVHMPGCRPARENASGTACVQGQ